MCMTLRQNRCKCVHHGAVKKMPLDVGAQIDHGQWGRRLVEKQLGNTDYN